MAKNTKSNTGYNWKKVISIILAVIIILGIGYIAGDKLTKKTTPTQAVNSKSAENAENATNNSRKQSSNPQSTLNNGSTTSTSTGSSTTSSSTPSSSTTATPATYQVQIVSYTINDGNLHIGNQVNGTESGDCTLTATKSGQSTLQLATSTVKQDVNDYDCGAFNIPTSQFPVSGDWTVVLTVTSGGASNSSSVSVDI